MKLPITRTDPIATIQILSVPLHPGWSQLRQLPHVVIELDRRVVGFASCFRSRDVFVHLDVVGCNSYIVSAVFHSLVFASFVMVLTQSSAIRGAIIALTYMLIQIPHPTVPALKRAIHAIFLSIQLFKLLGQQVLGSHASRVLWAHEWRQLLSIISDVNCQRFLRCH